MTDVFVLHHINRPDTDDENAKLIGIYATQEAGQRAIDRLKDMPGFRDPTGHFHLEAYQLDQDHWSEGFGPVDPGEG
jgi:hypothetical protein